MNKYCITPFDFSGDADLSSIRFARLNIDLISRKNISDIVKLLPHLNSLHIYFNFCDCTDLLDPLLLVKETLSNFSIHFNDKLTWTTFSLLPLVECRRLRNIEISVRQYTNNIIIWVRLFANITLHSIIWYFWVYYLQFLVTWNIFNNNQLKMCKSIYRNCFKKFDSHNILLMCLNLPISIIVMKRQNSKTFPMY